MNLPAYKLQPKPPNYSLARKCMSMYKLPKQAFDSIIP